MGPGNKNIVDFPWMLSNSISESKTSVSKPKALSAYSSRHA